MSPSLKPILAAALELVGDKGDAAAAAAAISKSIVPRQLEVRPQARARCVARIGLVLPGRARRRLVARDAAADRRLRRRAAASGALASAAARCSPAHGPCETICDGQSVSPIGGWQELCWQSDKKCDFLELGIELAEGLQLERQIVLSKRDNVLLVADIVSAKDRAPHKLRHSFSLPLARRVAWLPETETRDGVLLAAEAADRRVAARAARMALRSARRHAGRRKRPTHAHRSDRRPRRSIAACSSTSIRRGRRSRGPGGN